MYDETFDTDWDRLDRKAAVRRSFAIGVATILGDDLTEEFDRIHGDAGSAYDRTLIELAFNEGKRIASAPEHRNSKPATVWTDLVDPSGIERGRATGEHPSGLPEALRPSVSPRPTTTDLGRIRFPKFLTRR